MSLLTDVEELLHKVEMSQICLGDMIQDCKTVGEAGVRQEYQAKYEFMRELETCLRHGETGLRSLMRPKYAKPDLNQSELVADLRALGMVVWVTASLATPVLDLVVSWRGKVAIVEVKRPGQEADLTEGEVESIAELKAVGVPVIIATCAEDVVAFWIARGWIDEAR